MNKTSIILVPVFAVLTACGGLTKSEAKTKLKSVVAEQTAIACDCKASLSGIEGDELIEEEAKCQSNGQRELNRIAQDEGIESDFPEVLEDAKQEYTAQVEQCD